MKEKYQIAELLQGNKFIIYPGDDVGAYYEESKIQFIFYKDIFNNYREIFTEQKFILERSTHFDGPICQNSSTPRGVALQSFYTPYITNESSIKNNFFSEREVKLGYITKYRILEIYNKINLISKSNCDDSKLDQQV